jgi:single-stranded-DNA-specific exonuclease
MKLSIKKKIWQPKELDSFYISAAMQKYSISNLLAKLLYTRNIPLNEIEDFLDPKLKNLMPSPFSLLEMDKAVERILAALIKKQKIAIYGDYDVDGACSTAILTKYFSQLDIDVLIHIPDRMKEGYGINTEALKQLKDKGANLCISVDCGVTAFEPIANAKDFGLDMIVIDHHLSETTFPLAQAIVNPNRFDDPSNLGYLCASGVSFLLCVALNKHLRENNFFKSTEPDLLSLLDLVALGTVCDVMPLIKLNRAFVSQGLKIMSKRQNFGIAAISDISGLNKKPDVYSLGFLIGPRINATGRIGDCSLGAKILATDSIDFAKETAEILNQLNKQRQEIEKKIIEEALQIAKKQDSEDNPVLVLASENWHQGVIGIVAGRLKEAFNKPVAVIALSKGIGKASARSVSGIDFGSAIVNARANGILIAGGGHAMAAGFTVNENKIEELKLFLASQFKSQYKNYKENNILEFDLQLKISSVNLELANELEKLSPFGNGNPEPIISIDSAKIVKSKIVGEKHMQFYLSESGLAKNSATIKGVCFNCVGTELGDFLELNLMRNISLLGKIKKNIWNGSESVEFHIEDAFSIQ